MSQPPIDPTTPPTQPPVPPVPPEIPALPSAAAPFAAGPVPHQRRPGGKAAVSSEKALLRKNKTERVRARDWTRRFLEGRDEELEAAAGEMIGGKSDLIRKRVFVPPAQKAARQTSAGTELLRSYVTRVRGLFAHVWDPAAGRELPCSVRGVLKSFATQNRGVIAVGDRVMYRLTGADEGVIEAVEPRTTTLARSDSKRAGREHIVVANVEQIVVVASMRNPELRPRLIDRYLVSAAKGGLTPIVCLNKADLDDGKHIGFWSDLYGGLGYRVLATSAATGRGIEELRSLLAGKTSVVAGQSGVGKSSLLNAVQPGLNLRTGEISYETDKGRHTTTEVTLLPLTGAWAAGGAVVDTPGIRSFALWDLHPAELEGYYVEFADRVAGCKFADCTHRHETGCAIRAAVEAAEIREERYDSYLALYESLETGREDPRD